MAGCIKINSEEKRRDLLSCKLQDNFFRQNYSTSVRVKVKSIQFFRELQKVPKFQCSDVPEHLLTEKPPTPKGEFGQWFRVNGSRFNVQGSGFRVIVSTLYYTSIYITSIYIIIRSYCQRLTSLIRYLIYIVQGTRKKVLEHWNIGTSIPCTTQRCYRCGFLSLQVIYDLRINTGFYW